MRPLRKPQNTRSTLSIPTDVRDMLTQTAARIRKLDLQGWYAEITSLYRLSIDHGLNLHSDQSQVIRLKDGSIGQIGGPYTAYVFDLNMPDDCIMHEFRRFLEEGRTVVTSPVAKPGPKSFNSKFDAHVFSRWRDLKIVEYAELLAWRVASDAPRRKRVSKAEIGRWIGRHVSKDVTKTEALLKNALASLPALGAQMAHNMSLKSDVHDRQAIRARIERDIGQ